MHYNHKNIVLFFDENKLIIVKRDNIRCIVLKTHAGYVSIEQVLSIAVKNLNHSIIHLMIYKTNINDFLHEYKELLNKPLYVENIMRNQRMLRK